MATIYEHSFGFWEIDGQEEQTFRPAPERMTGCFSPLAEIRRLVSNSISWARGAI
jgi:hypothetical protein